MSWHAVHDGVTGRLVSVGEIVANPVPPGLVVVNLPGPPTRDKMWDEATRKFVPRPAPVPVDVVGDITTKMQADPQWSNLRVADRTRIVGIVQRAFAGVVPDQDTR